MDDVWSVDLQVKLPDQAAENIPPLHLWWGFVVLWFVSVESLIVSPDMSSSARGIEEEASVSIHRIWNILRCFVKRNWPPWRVEPDVQFNQSKGNTAPSTTSSEPTEHLPPTTHCVHDRRILVGVPLEEKVG